MAITGKQTVAIGLPNESQGSDSLYTAFTKINNNFDTLFACASPYNTFAGGNGISVNTNGNTNTVTITNSGVTSLVAGTNITLSGSNGQVTISAIGGGNGGGGTVTSIGITPSPRLTVTGSPIVSSGNMMIDLAVSGVTAGSYSNPVISVDGYGRVTSAANGNSGGTVTSVAVSPGNGIQVTGSPITSNGTITITNTGVTRLNAGSGIFLTGTTGEITISAPVTGGTVTSVNLTSSTLTVTGAPVVTAGTITVDLPTNPTRYGSFYSNVLQTNPIANAVNKISFNNTIGASNVSVASSSQLTVTRAGTYNIQFSAQAAKTDAGTNFMEVWLSKNGNAIPFTNNKFTLIGSNNMQVVAWNFVQTASASDYFEINWASPDTAVQLTYIDAANTTANVDIPSATVMITPVSG